jgi:hypothetical protein
VSLFVLSPEIEDRDEVEIGNWAKHKKIIQDFTPLQLACLQHGQ